MDVRGILQSFESEGVLSGVERARLRRWRAKVKPRDVRRLAELMGSLKAHLSAITCVDLGDNLELIYHYDLDGELVSVSVQVPKVLPVLPSIADVYPPADFYEREISEMFGVKFEGATRVRRLILPDEWPLHEYPMRRWCS